MKRLFLICSFLLIGLTGKSQNVLDGVYIKENTPNRRVIPYAPLRESDVMWSKRIWRQIDIREKLNLPIYYPIDPANGRKSLLNVILDGVSAGELIAFSAKEEGIDDFREQLTRSEAINQLVDIRKKEVEDVDNPGVFYERIDTSRVAADDLIGYELKEDWFFDKQRSVLDVRVIGICPIVKTYDEKGLERGKKRLFWLYYPNCRQLFAKSETYNTQNDAERRTYEDIFWKRLYSSYIIKESNVYNRTLGSDGYLKGIDILYKGEQIKKEIFEFEQNMWQY
jgi:gliding motility associated protien GldN